MQPEATQNIIHQRHSIPYCDTFITTSGAPKSIILLMLVSFRESLASLTLSSCQRAGRDAMHFNPAGCLRIVSLLIASCQFHNFLFGDPSLTEGLE
jgi:hypothetical protein